MKKGNGFYVLLAASLCGLIAASLGLCFNCVGVFFTPMADALNIKRGSIAMTSTITTFVSAFAAMVAPRILTRTNMKKIILTGVIMASASTLLYACSTQLWQFYILSAVRGFGFGLYGMVVVTLIVNNWFVSKNGLVTSIAMCFSGIFGSVGSPVFTALITKNGWQFAYIVMGIVTLVVSLPGVIVPYTLYPEDCGWEPYRDGKEQKKDTGAQKSGTPQSAKPFTAGIFLILAVMGLATGSMTAFTQHLPAISESFGFSASIGALTVSCALVGNMLSKLIIGIMSDRFGIQISFVALMGVCLAGLFMIGFAHVIPAALVGAFFFGFIYGSSGIGISFMTRFYAGMERYGKVYSILAVPGSIGSAVLLSLIGYIYDFTGGYMPALFIVIALDVIAILGAVILMIRDKS